MRIENPSQNSFGKLNFNISRTNFRYRDILKLSELIHKQSENPVGVDFFEDSMHKLQANLYVNEPYFQYDKVLKKRFRSDVGFIQKMCKKADKLAQELECARLRYEMFVSKNKIKQQ